MTSAATAEATSRIALLIFSPSLVGRGKEGSQTTAPCYVTRFMVPLLGGLGICQVAHLVADPLRHHSGKLLRTSLYDA
jgi:hypothetical protein